MKRFNIGMVAALGFGFGVGLVACADIDSVIAAGENPHYLTFHRHGTPRVRTIWALRRLAPQAQRNALLGLDSYARCARCAPQYGQKHPRLSAGVGGPRRGRVERE